MSSEGQVTPPSEWVEPHESDPISRIRAVAHAVREDVNAVLSHDPAARSRLEVVLTYPGLHAIWGHRIANALWKRENKLAARVMSHLNRFTTGVEIHPGATIGRGVFIDHGMGVVIGETARVGDGCILFKGVVLGGTSMEKKVRHPQLGKNVVVGSNACVLGAIPIGDGARVGSGSVVVRPVPADGTVVGVPGRVVSKADDRGARFDATLDHASLPDPVTEMMRSLRSENERLRQRLSRVEEAVGVNAADEEDDDPYLLDPRLATTDLPPQAGG